MPFSKTNRWHRFFIDTIYDGDEENSSKLFLSVAYLWVLRINTVWDCLEIVVVYMWQASKHVFFFSRWFIQVLTFSQELKGSQIGLVNVTLMPLGEYKLFTRNRFGVLANELWHHTYVFCPTGIGTDQNQM